MIVWALETRAGVDSLYTEYSLAIEAGRIYAGEGATLSLPQESNVQLISTRCHGVFKQSDRGVVAWILQMEVLDTLD